MAGAVRKSKMKEVPLSEKPACGPRRQIGRRKVTVRSDRVGQETSIR